MTNPAGEPLLKKWRFICSSKRLAAALSTLRCEHPSGFKHGEIVGSVTKSTESYPMRLCNKYLAALFGSAQCVPSMPVCPSSSVSPVHREKDVHQPGFTMSPATAAGHLMSSVDVYDPDSAAVDPVGPEEEYVPLSVRLGVTKLLERWEMHSDPKAIAAVKAEAAALVEAGTWDESSVIEKEQLLELAKKSCKKLHLGELMPICSIKFAECEASKQKHKGRICFRGDNVKDSDGAVAVFQELSASPTTVPSANANIAYGCIPGHQTTQADAVRAYVQADLRSLNETWVLIPKELRPPGWKFKRPYCRLLKALYGHPESGAHWERHLTAAVKSVGGTAVEGHPSSFWFEDKSLLLTVYVDDLLLSGPVSAHNPLWEALRSEVKLDDPEPLSRFLGRAHDMRQQE